MVLIFFCILFNCSIIAVRIVLNKAKTKVLKTVILPKLKFVNSKILKRRYDIWNFLQFLIFFKGVINFEFLNSLIFRIYKSDSHSTKCLNLLQETNSRYFTFVLFGLRLEKEEKHWSSYYVRLCLVTRRLYHLHRLHKETLSEISQCLWCICYFPCREKLFQK